MDYDLVVAEVLSVFGRYVKYNVEKEAGSEPPQVLCWNLVKSTLTGSMCLYEVTAVRH